jgi:hypothetical protein
MYLERPQQPEPGDVVRVRDSNHLRERLSAGSTNERSQQRVPRGLRPGEHILKFAKGARVTVR